ncbi:MAG: hypothetical protein J7L39_01240 [Candidatus Aenigmarchaeota archaeon]|nr:hypothetical protein [Candidatus Aenigmarchaeota archaeon]
MTKLDKKIETVIRKKVEEIFKKHTGGWALPHTLRTVYWMKKLIQKEGGNERILIPAAYFHDIGYVETKVGKRDTLVKPALHINLILHKK